ncbi:MAG TPA: SMC family ATPase [Actinomycetales bacterium]|nr:SMC family ATPase [Actinomycetales bacterium]
MRLHRLRVQAFGPFAAVEEVDVDALCEQGLFLLHGPTGAGKTSVLDALCFALYGRVPGARSGAGLRSDHAESDLAPEVRCEFTAAGRRLEVTRSPAWTRPKKRGEGTTTEQARTLLREKVGGEWLPRSSRNDEASQLLTDVLGMGMEQFTKVVLLPQGEFAAFLRAPADERRALLQRLFATDRFADVETWLSDARRTTETELERAEAGLDRLMARVSESAAVVPSPPGDDDVPADPVERVQQLVTSAHTARDVATEEQQTAGNVLEAVRTERAEALRRYERAETLGRVTAALARLEAESATVAEAGRALARADAAASVSGHLASVASAQGRVEATASEEAAATGGVLALSVGVPDGDALASGVRERSEQVGRLGDLVEAEDDAARAAELAASRTQQVTALEQERRHLAARIEPLQRRREDGARQQQALAAFAAEVGAREAAVEQARTAHAAAVDAARLDVAVDALREKAIEAGAGAQEQRRRWLDLREDRLTGMAAELAASLTPGDACPVCGSEDHPGVATPATTAVTATDEADARTASDDAAEAARVVADALATAREGLAGARSRSDGATTAVTAAAVTDLTRGLGEAQDARAALADLVASLVAVDAELEKLRAADAETAQALAAARVASEAATAQATSAHDRLATARGEDLSVRARVERLVEEASALEALGEARAALAAARSAHASGTAEATGAVVAAGFADLGEAAAAALGEDVRARLRAVLSGHAEELAAVRSRLAEPDLVEAASDAVDPCASAAPEEPWADRSSRLEARVEQAAATERQAVERVAVLRRAAATLDDLVQHVAADVAAAAPVRSRHELVADLARCAEGTGGGNAMRMRLSAFVLAARLEQVAAAATERLDAMSSGRYALVHSDARERGGARSGLGLQVVDAWTGLHRDTASLSGGEAFLASLSLALGLADVVQAESGGSIIETLFVDEGFGSLDSETLDEVMTTLDSLREGGRAVGLVSHVAELRQRIPTRLEVVKTPTGSHLRSRADAA